MSGAARWVVATGNAGKLREFETLCAGIDATLEPLDRFTRERVDETAPTFVENALIKARHAAAASGLPALADDSGLLVDALGGAPGVRSARFAGPAATDQDNVAKLLAALADRPAAERAAEFRCVLVWLHAPDDPAPLIAEGVWRGAIAERPAGAGGFGYDPVFFDPALGVTAAELTPACKNEVSHRARALTTLRRLLDGRLAARLGAG